MAVVRIVCAVVVAAFAVMGCIYGLHELRQSRANDQRMQAASRDLDDAVAQYRGLGLPWVASDLAPRPPVSSANNAAPLLEMAIKDAMRTDRITIPAMKNERDEPNGLMDGAADAFRLVDRGQIEEALTCVEAYSRTSDLVMQAASKIGWTSTMTGTWGQIFASTNTAL